MKNNIDIILSISALCLSLILIALPINGRLWGYLDYKFKLYRRGKYFCLLLILFLFVSIFQIIRNTSSQDSRDETQQTTLNNTEKIIGRVEKSALRIENTSHRLDTLYNILKEIETTTLATIKQNNILSKPIIEISIPSFVDENFTWYEKKDGLDQGLAKITMVGSIQNYGGRTTSIEYVGFIVESEYSVKNMKDGRAILYPMGSIPLRHTFLISNNNTIVYYYCIKVIYHDTVLNQLKCVYEIIQSLWHLELERQIYSILGTEESKRIAFEVSKYMKTNCPQYGGFEGASKTTVAEY